MLETKQNKLIGRNGSDDDNMNAHTLVQSIHGIVFSLQNHYPKDKINISVGYEKSEQESYQWLILKTLHSLGIQTNNMYIHNEKVKSKKMYENNSRKELPIHLGLLLGSDNTIPTLEVYINGEKATNHFMRNVSEILKHLPLDKNISNIVMYGISDIPEHELIKVINNSLSESVSK